MKRNFNLDYDLDVESDAKRVESESSSRPQDQNLSTTSPASSSPLNRIYRDFQHVDLRMLQQWHPRTATHHLVLVAPPANPKSKKRNYPRNAPSITSARSSSSPLETQLPSSLLQKMPSTSLKVKTKVKIDLCRNQWATKSSPPNNTDSSVPSLPPANAAPSLITRTRLCQI